VNNDFVEVRPSGCCRPSTQAKTGGGLEPRKATPSSELGEPCTLPNERYRHDNPFLAERSPGPRGLCQASINLPLWRGLHVPGQPAVPAEQRMDEFAPTPPGKTLPTGRSGPKSVGRAKRPRRAMTPTHAWRIPSNWRPWHAKRQRGSSPWCYSGALEAIEGPGRGKLGVQCRPRRFHHQVNRPIDIQIEDGRLQPSALAGEIEALGHSNKPVGRIR